MKTTNIKISKSISQLGAILSSFFSCISLPLQAWRKSQGKTAVDELPLRSSLFSAAQMEQHGRFLSENQRLAPKPGRNRLLNRLAANDDAIIDACAHLISAIHLGRQITPAAEWLLDNFYIIEEQIYTAKRHLPPNYSQQLPRLSNGNSEGLPRVYDLALEIIAHGDGRIDPENLSSFITAYQEKQELMLGELWAIPIMLRLALIENLRRVAVSIKEARIHRNLACEWADRLAKGVEEDSNNLILLVADMARSNPPMQSTFVAEFVRCLQAQNPSLLLPLSWLTQRLAESNQHIEGMIQTEAQHQAADQVSISNSIASLRLLSGIDWQIFVENLSHVEQCLRRDPCDIYRQMSFATRDQYRHVVEHIARHSTMSELEVAQTALLLAVQNNVTRERKPPIFDQSTNDQSGNDPAATEDLRETHLGYYLIGDGKQKLESTVKYKTPFHKAWRVYLGRHALGLYLTSIFLLSVAMSLLLLQLVDLSLVSVTVIIFTSLFCWIALSHFGVALVNWGVTMITLPRPLARMDFSLGIPAESATLVVVPCMLNSQANIDRLVEALEIRFLGNQDRHLRFCLLSDFADAATATMPGDAGLLRYAEKSIDLLNQKYRCGIVNSGTDGLAVSAQAANDDVSWDYFLLFHRPRLWNEQEQCWMGYERKRGKLAALNAYLRGHGRLAFNLIVGADETLLKTRYIITLDADTELPRDAARKFIATMAHPLNRARYDTRLQRVVAGYGILQPRIAISLPSEQASRYELLCAGEIGIDPYTRTVSDVYQDLFGEGSFIGKGIYEIDTFELALKDRLPENRILSHDLLEGCYARAGLLSDVELHEQQPASYQADAMRRHRWIRGDWQIASWLLSRVPTHAEYQKNAGNSCRNPLSPLSRWKLLDNLRRSLVPIVLMGLLIISWSLFSFASFGVIVAVISLCSASLLSIAHSIFALIRPRADLNWRGALKSFLWQTKQQLTQAFLSISFLPFEAYSHLDAILRTQWRVSISKKQLLEWTPSSETNRHAGDSWRATYRSMWIAPFSSIVIFSGLAIARPEAIAGALGFLVLWLFAPLSAAWISRAAPTQTLHLTQKDEKYLHLLARKTWLFFERFVNAENHWLPLDNVQEFPIPVMARRTSPTNIGLSLLANLSAYDFSFISSSRLLERCSLCIDTMQRLPRFQGHFYNWYNTEDLQPLLPQYVSTVDSGNLAGHMLILRAGLSSLPTEPIFRWSYFGALKDTYHILCSHLTEQNLKSLANLGIALDQACMRESNDLLIAHRALIDIRDLCVNLADLLPDTSGNQTDDVVQVWRDALIEQSQDLLTDLEHRCPWLHKSHLLSHERIQAFSELSVIPSHQALVQLHEDFLAHIDQFQQSENTASSKASNDFSGGLRSEFEVATILSETEQSQAQAQFNQFILHVHQLTLLASARASTQLLAIKALCAKIDELSDMEYDFLYNRTSHLLAIGYNVTERRLDSGAYDLLASEARLATFVGIAQNKLPQESWFALGRQLTIANGEPILLSWSGSMFEYLMPLLVMPDFKHTLLHQTYHAAVQRQIDYGKERQIPWGISESAYNLTDSNLNYQYRAFGVPGLGFKRSLGDDLVVAPYATVMALMVMPKEACENLQRMGAMGFEGQYGFYEAIDFTTARLARAQTHVVIRSFMSHHQGMSLLALAFHLLDQPLQKRFAMEARFQAALPLLHERVPKTNSNYSNTSELADIRTHSNQQEMAMRVLHRADHRTPEVQLLSNGRYHLMVTSAGGSASRWNDLAINRWREDATRDHWGSFCFLRELDVKGRTVDQFWSSTFQPSLVQPDNMEVIFSEGRAEFRRTDHQLLQHTEIVVSPEDDIELRRTHITNRSRTARILELTSYSEVVLNIAAADTAHPAFSNLFVETEIDFERQAILCNRRRRSDADSYPWMFHLFSVHGTSLQAISYETDRSLFIGRTQNLNNPRAMQESGPLSNSQGSVLDPIVAIRIQIRIEPEQTVSIDLVTGIANDKQHALDLTDKYRDRHLADRVIELSWTHSQVTLRQLNISESEAQIYARLASSIIFINPLLRADSQVLVQNRRGQSALWSYAISGDLPIVLVKIKDQANIELVRQLIKAHTYWKSKGLAVDLVIWNEEHNGYRQALQEQIAGLVSGLVAGLASVTPITHVANTHSTKEKQGGIFLRSLDQISIEDRQLFLSVARISLSDVQGGLLEQMNRRPAVVRSLPDLIGSDMPDGGTTYLASLLGQNAKQKRNALTLVKKESAESISAKVNKSTFDTTTLLEDNGLGGFARDGRSYVVHSQAHMKTPAPWVNVIANAQLGTVISESGQSYTWAANAHEYRLTPWSNDAVTDAGAEVFYIRNERTGKFWSPLPLPISGDTEYSCRHGFGYSEFEHEEEQIASHLTVFVSLDAPIKYTILRLHNRSGQKQEISLTSYVEWVLGDVKEKTQMHINTRLEKAQESGAHVILARNPYHADFSHFTAFNQTLCNDGQHHTQQTLSYTADRSEFIGRNRSLENPVAMQKRGLSGKLGAGLDACAAFQYVLSLEPNESREFVFMLGALEVGNNAGSDAINNLLALYSPAEKIKQELQAVHQFWQKTLGVIQVKTPEPSFDLLANGWLLYQTLSARMWGRSGFYQSGGAFGFRDQLQDSMALVHSQSALVRQHLLLAASHQFIEGDVQHWWHPPGDRGVRTRCSDDFLWLVAAVHRYVTVTGDKQVLEESVAFLEGRALNQDEDSYYDMPLRSQQTATLYAHCVAAIEHANRLGEHGLCLIGSGDWNDGFDLVGHLGKGESVWLSFFAYQILNDFSPIAQAHGDDALVAQWRDRASALHNAIEISGWDGAWYRRAYFDDGSMLGSAQNQVCQIDSIAQSWAVLSGVGNKQHNAIAMQSMLDRLVKTEAGLVQLLAPPFDQEGQNPGYIRAYVPGVRENGGQYTHAAIWAVMALCKLDRKNEAWELIRMINPIHHGNSADAIARYKVEPYVLAADVYAVAPHVGRGGWTWYTGSAAWMVRVMWESLLGLEIKADQLRICPCIPTEWDGFSMTYQYRSSRYEITVKKTTFSGTGLSLDDVPQMTGWVTMCDDGKTHQVLLLLPTSTPYESLPKFEPPQFDLH